MYMMLALAAASHSAMALLLHFSPFSASVPGFVISAYYRLSDVFGEILATIFID